MKNYRYDKISTYFKLNLKTIILVTISGLIYNVLMVFVPIIQGKLIDYYSTSNDVKYILYFAISFLVFVIFIQFNRYLKRFFVRDFANRMSLTMRKVSFKNLLYQDISLNTSLSKGDIMNRNLSDIKDTAEGVRKALTEAFDTMVLFLGYTIYLLIMDYKTTLISYVFIILAIITSRLLKSLIYKNVSKYKKVYSSNKDLTLNLINNEVYYRGYGCSKRYFNQYVESQNKLEKISIKSMMLKDSLEPIYLAISLIGLIFVIYNGSNNVINNVWLIGTFSSYLTTYLLVSRKASKLGKLFNALASFKVSWARIKPYLNSVDTNKTVSLDDNKDYLLEANHLTFGFDDSFKVKDISFNLKQGTSMGICGSIRKGKSTLLASLSGLYDYEGSIKLCGLELKDIKDYNIDHFIAYIPQNNEIFESTINYNISYDDSNNTRYIKDALLDEDINKFNNKEYEVITHNNTSLSGGQIKRLLISRALASSSRLILLDDPFNATNISMSEEILDNVLNESKNSIVVIVNNKKEILSKLDYILFLKDDTYILSTYEELIKNEEFNELMGGVYER
jgi:ATP-binding cassette, subfamily B, multidrug efflux pump